MNREDIQNKIYRSDAFKSYKSADDQQKEDCYFSCDLNSQERDQLIDSESLFSFSVKALKLKIYSDALIDLNYDLHILLVGTTLQPLMLSVSAINADNIMLLYASDGTERKKDRLFDYIKAYKSIEANALSVNSSEPYTIFSAIKNIVESKEWKDKKICLDITGGKKSMVGGGFLSSSILGIDTYYIDFQKYENGSPVLCTEFLNKLDNPYDIYNIKEELIIKSLWERQDFDAVINVISLTLNKFTEKNAEDYNLTNERNRLIQIQKAACCYSKWSKFNYAGASENTLFDYYIIQHQNILFTLSNCVDLRKTAYGSILLAIDRWMRGGDAFVLDDYDKAALCFTQTIEILCSYRLFDMSQQGKLSGGTFEYGNNPRNKKPHSPEANGCMRFVFAGVNQQESVTIYNAGMTLKWKDDNGNANRFVSDDSEFSIEAIADHLNLRNELAHFSCFSSIKISEIHKQILQFQEHTHKLLKYFIREYETEELDVLKPRFKFAQVNEFDIIFSSENLLYGGC
jgi:hypothetical protein